MHLEVKKGLDIPILGKPIENLGKLAYPKTLALDLDPFSTTRFTLLKKIGDKVEIGEALAEDKAIPDRKFASPASGVLKEIVRGLKRRILHLIIECDATPRFFEHPPRKEELFPYLQKCGLSPHIRVFPCQRLPEAPPEAVFIKALETAPFAPPPEFEVQGYEAHFQHGLSALAELCPVYLVHHQHSDCIAFKKAQDVQIHTAGGPHPSSHPSLHIASIHPLKNARQTIWSLTVHDVIAIGILLKERRYYNERVISIAGEGIPKDKRGFVRACLGFPVKELIRGRCEENSFRFLSGDPLMGTKVNGDDYLKFFDSVFCVLPQPGEKRRFAHFMRFFSNSYTRTGAYFKKREPFAFTTLQHGEERAFIDGALYESVMPLRIPVMHLIKAILAEEYELAESLGLLTVAPEDFALPAFICPSKIEMIEIVRQGLEAYAKQFLEN